MAAPLLHGDPRRPTLPNPDASGIQHIVVLTMENRSFDHFLGWMKGADGRQSGLTYHDKSNVPYSTYHLTEYQGCGHPLPDNTSSGAIVEYNNGACDGWLRAGSNDRFVIGYYEQKDLPFLGEAATEWTTCDRYFAATLSETFPNRMYLHAGQDGPAGQLADFVDAADHLGHSTGCAAQLPLLLQRRPIPGAVGRQVSTD